MNAMTEDGARLVDELRPYVADERVLAAVAAVPRELFVPAAQRERAYENCALGIGCGQTISQPLVVARMCELLELRAGDRVLDVGTGSGYHAAVLARLVAEVVSVERHARLSRRARRALAEAGATNVTLHVGDGAEPVRGERPFDAINVAAAMPARELESFEARLAPGGRLVAPVTGEEQRLVLCRRAREGGGFERRALEAVRFVPLIR
jgi:protein-L-isoaspartate(D-aspartate) O-methyltransferase